MTTGTKKQQYCGFEQGPIRPPSEANSLLIRVTRNCPWNHCTFCSIYKDEQFSLRPVEHIIADIDAICEAVQLIQRSTDTTGSLSVTAVSQLVNQYTGECVDVFYTALDWMRNGGDAIFLQDANSLVINPASLVIILNHCKKCFPWVKRITSYARSRTIDKISSQWLEEIAQAGLNRIHIGLESGSDKVLKLTKKGVTKEQHINAGKKVKDAGMELSEYFMPGLGGSSLSEEHVSESASALNQINPDFIRLRTLVIPPNMVLFEQEQEIHCQKLSGVEMVGEIESLIDQLDDISSILKSDHILNLMQEVEGKFPDDKKKMLDILNQFLVLPPHEQMLFQIGKRLGLLHCVHDLQSDFRRSQIEQLCMQKRINPGNVDDFIEQQLNNFI